MSQMIYIQISVEQWKNKSGIGLEQASCIMIQDKYLSNTTQNTYYPKFGYHKCRIIDRKVNTTKDSYITLEKIRKVLTIAKNKHLHNNNASPITDLPCISRPKQ
jgi:hypothetical protein